MDMSTALTAFFFECPVRAQSVELLGSWDNFSKPYPLRRDRRRGPHAWAGCFTFEDIICDGDPSNIGLRRSGPLKAGGTYWYYYKVDDGEEYHNPSQPSTSVCPLLPGQTLNILDVPMESAGACSPDTFDAFTRNPNDRYLTPVPPKALAASRHGRLSPQPLGALPYPTDGPRSATYPSWERSLSPQYDHQRSRSACTSPYLGAGPTLLDFKGLKEKTAVLKRTTHGNHKRTNTKDLQIGKPVLISSTAECLSFGPTGFRAQTLKVSPKLPSKPSPHISDRMKEFSALRSHPVDPHRDLNIQFPDERGRRGPRRPKSHIVPSIKVSQGRNRAYSEDTRRSTQYGLFSNEPWMSSPRPPSYLGDSVTAPLRLCQRPLLDIDSDISEQTRPVSRQGEAGSKHLHVTQPEKELPALPAYVSPESLFVDNHEEATPVPHELEDISRPNLEKVETSSIYRKRISEQSPDSVGSIIFSSFTSDEEEDPIPSSTSSSFTSSISETVSPKQDHFAFDDTTKGNKSLTDVSTTHSSSASASENTSTPQLPRLSVTSVLPKLFDMKLHRTDSTPRRHVACFGYSGQQQQQTCAPPAAEPTMAFELAAPETSLATEPPRIDFDSLSTSLPRLDFDRGSASFETLVSEFGFLGQAVY